MHTNKPPVPFIPFILLALTICFGIGFLLGRSSSQSQENTLCLTVTEDMDAGFREITSDELGGNFDCISYVDIATVSISLDGKTMLLEDSIRDGLVTVEQLIAQAKEDARNGNCILKYDTTLGLSEFIYSYPESYDLKVCYDVFECSDGKQHLLSDFVITPPGRAQNLSFGFRYYDENGNEVQLKYEDWGLEFTVTELSPTGISLDYIQQGGMAVGDLSVKWFHVYNDQGMMNEQLELPMEPIYIQKNAEGEFTLNWEPMLGALPSGEYTLVLYVYDNFDESEIHPLIQKYCYGQYYSIPFTIS